MLLVSLSDTAKALPADPSASVHVTNNGIRLSPLFGDTLALLSALFYALYVILLKVKIRSESRIDMQLFFGFVGLFSIVATWPIGVVLHLTGLERFELPHTNKTIAALLINVGLIYSF